MPTHYNANVKIRDFPRASDEVLNLLATARSVPKYEIVRAALIEYAEKHKGEIVDKCV